VAERLLDHDAALAHAPAELEPLDHLREEIRRHRHVMERSRSLAEALAQGLERRRIW